jgi:hypothetical protein
LLKHSQKLYVSFLRSIVSDFKYQFSVLLPPRLFVASRKDLNSMNESYEIEAAKFQHRQTDGWNCGIYVLEVMNDTPNYDDSFR